MPGDELFKRYLEIGASVLGMSRERAESIVRDLVASGEVARSQATKAADWLVDRGRAGTEELAEVVRREIRDQVAALGLATRDDLQRLEARIEEVRASAANAATPTTAAAAQPAANAPARKAPATRPPGTKAPARKAPATKPQATKPPATRAPATSGPATRAPATTPPATGAPASKRAAPNAPAKSAGGSGRAAGAVASAGIRRSATVGEQPATPTGD